MALSDFTHTRVIFFDRFYPFGLNQFHMIGLKRCSAGQCLWDSTFPYQQLTKKVTKEGKKKGTNF